MKLSTSLLLFFMLPFAATFAQSGKIYHVKSPDGKIDVAVSVGKTISWMVKHESNEIITPSTVSMTLDNGEVLGADQK